MYQILRCVDILMGQSRLWILAVFESHAKFSFRQTRETSKTEAAAAREGPWICRIPDTSPLNTAPKTAWLPHGLQCAGTAVKELTWQP